MSAFTPSPEPELGPEDLDAVIAGGGVSVAFQPVIDLARASVVGYEALARFDGPVPSPLPWFEAAQRHGRLVELEAAALRSALEAHAILPTNTFLTVNIGPGSIDTPLVRAVWDDHPSLGGVVIELTEHERIDSYTNLEPALDRLRSAGARLAIGGVEGEGEDATHRIPCREPARRAPGGRASCDTGCSRA